MWHFPFTVKKRRTSAMVWEICHMLSMLVPIPSTAIPSYNEFAKFGLFGGQYRHTRGIELPYSLQYSQMVYWNVSWTQPVSLIETCLPGKWPSWRIEDLQTRSFTKVAIGYAAVRVIVDKPYRFEFWYEHAETGNSTWQNNDDCCSWILNLSWRRNWNGFQKVIVRSSANVSRLFVPDWSYPDPGLPQDESSANHFDQSMFSRTGLFPGVSSVIS
jgi:hypothetical protein